MRKESRLPQLIGNEKASNYRFEMQMMYFRVCVCVEFLANCIIAVCCFSCVYAGLSFLFVFVNW